MNKTFEISTYDGVPCLWESGGGTINTGSAIVISDIFGNPKTPICVRTHGQHALIPIEIYDYIFDASHVHGVFDIMIYTVISINGDTLIAAPIAHFSKGRWDHGYCNPHLEKPLDAVTDKIKDVYRAT